jgi:hypothetical protein
MACSLFLFHVTNENHFLLSKIPKKRVMLSPFYPRCNAKQQPQSQPGIKRAKDLAELLRPAKSQAQGTIACCLVSVFSWQKA